MIQDKAFQIVRGEVKFDELYEASIVQYLDEEYEKRNTRGCEIITGSTTGGTAEVYHRPLKTRKKK